MSDLIVSQESQAEEECRPPLFLQHYFNEREGQGLEEPVFKPPGIGCRARIVERRDNVIVLEFCELPVAVPKRRVGRFRHLCRNGWDAAMLLLLLASAAACFASFVR